MPVFVNKAEITDDMIHAEMQYHRADSAEDAKQKATEALVIKELLLQELSNQRDDYKRGDVLSPDIEEQYIDELIKQEVTLPLADESSCRHYYQSNQQRFTDSKNGKVMPFEQVAEQIKDYLYTQSLYNGVNLYIKALLDRATIAPPVMG